MILAIDIGNTNIVIGCIEDEQVLFTERMSTDSRKTMMDYAVTVKRILEIQKIDREKITGSIISSVVPPVTATMGEAIFRLTEKEALVVSSEMKTGFELCMDQPNKVGCDLIVAAAAGVRDYPLPLIFVDLGTATTFSAVDAQKRYIGTIIIPGVRVGLEALAGRTSQLPHVSLDAPGKVLGTNTIASLQSGAVYGHAACIDGMIDRIEKEMGGEATVVATGGLAPLVTGYCRRKIIIDDEMLLRGLMYLYELNTEV